MKEECDEQLTAFSCAMDMDVEEDFDVDTLTFRKTHRHHVMVAWPWQKLGHWPLQPTT